MSFDTATPYIASHVIIRSGNKIGFILRKNTDWMNGFYTVPSGKVEQDETYLASAVRETKEEVGIDIATNDLKFVHLMHRKSDLSWVDVYFEAIKFSGEPYNAEPDNHGEFAWFDQNNLPKNIVPCVKLALDKIADKEPYSEYGW